MSLEPNDSPLSLDDSNVRPWLHGGMEHNDPLATIVLFQDGGATPSPDDQVIDYLNDLSHSVAPLVPESDIVSTNTSDTVAGGKIPIFKLDGLNDYYGVFNNFSLTSFNELHSQIVKVHMNFSASWNAFFLGEQPKMYQFSGYFVDTMDYPYYQEFMTAFEQYLSGRKSIEAKLQTKLCVSGQIINGYLINLTVMHNANTTALKQFQFTMLVKDSSWIRNNIIIELDQPTGLKKSLIQYNGLANISRLTRQSLTALIDTNTPSDNPGRTANR